MEQFDIRWFEEPVSHLDVPAYLEVKAAPSIPLAGGECEYTRTGFQKWFEAGRWHLPEAPGLGVAVVPEAVEPYLATTVA